MRYVTIYDDNKNKICDVHKLAWDITEKGMPLGFLGGYILASYMWDEKKEHGFFFHMIEALRVWWDCKR